MKLQDVLKDSLLGNILAHVEKIIDSGYFQEVGDQVCQGDTVVGNMEPVEKALYTLRWRIVDNINDIRIGSFIVDWQENEIKQKAPEIIQQIANELTSLSMYYRTIDSLLWNCISVRFPTQVVESGTGFGVRNGFKVVVWKEKKEEQNILPFSPFFAPPTNTMN